MGLGLNSSSTIVQTRKVRIREGEVTAEQLIGRTPAACSLWSWQAVLVAVLPTWGLCPASLVGEGGLAGPAVPRLRVVHLPFPSPVHYTSGS